MIPDLIDPAKVQVTPTRYGRMMSLSNDRYLGRALTRFGEYSESEVDLWRQILQPNWIVCDVGANIGAHTVALANIVPQGLVVAFEPLRFMYHLLCGNLALNGLSNVKAFHAAAGKTRGVIHVPGFDYTQQENYGGIALGGFAEGNPVPQLTLDESVGQAHFLKVDVEGMELDVLLGAQRLIAECHPILYLECNPGEGEGYSPTQRALIRHVQSLGYDVWWHHAPHFNPHNLNAGLPEDEHEASVVSFNILCVHNASTMQGLGDPIPLLEDV